MDKSVGFVEFRDLQIDMKTRITINRSPQMDLTFLFLDQHTGGESALGAGDVEIGLDRENLRSLLTSIQRAKGVPLTQTPRWILAGRVEFSWSDHADQS